LLHLLQAAAQPFLCTHFSRAMLFAAVVSLQYSVYAVMQLLRQVGMYLTKVMCSLARLTQLAVRGLLDEGLEAPGPPSRSTSPDQQGRLASIKVWLSLLG
jgi:hypothetical protein